MQTPECLIIAGPNGGGKTSVYRHLLARGKFPTGLAYVNTDDNLRELQQHMPSASDISAARISIVRINDLVEKRQGFVFETTLSSQHSIRTMRRARQAGFRIGLIFVLLQSVELHIARVATRVAQGGHFVSEAEIRRRYIAAQQNLRIALDLFDEGYVIDNSPSESPRRVLGISDGRIGKLEDFDERSSFDTKLWYWLADYERPW